MAAPPLAYTPANGSSQDRRARPKGSPVLACALSGKHLDRLWAVLGVSGAQNQHFTLFSDTPWTFFAQNVAKVYRCTDRQSAKWAKDRLMVSIIVVFACFEVPSGGKSEILGTDGQ